MSACYSISKEYPITTSVFPKENDTLLITSLKVVAIAILAFSVIGFPILLIADGIHHLCSSRYQLPAQTKPRLPEISIPIPDDSITKPLIKQSSLESPLQNPPKRAPIAEKPIEDDDWEMLSESEETDLSCAEISSWLNNFSIQKAISFIWQATTGWTSFLNQVFCHENHSLHNQKYQLALESQENALRIFLVDYAFTPEDLLQNLKKALKKEPMEKPYQSIFQKVDFSSSFVSDFIGALDALLHPDHFPAIRERNATYLLFLRNAIQSNEYKNNCNPLLNDILKTLCWAKFTQNNMADYEDDFIKMAVLSADPNFSLYKDKGDRLTRENVAGFITGANECLKNADPKLRKAPQDLLWQKATNEVGIFSDPLGTSNTPEVRSIHKVQNGRKNYEIIFMRHGTVTIEPGISSFVNRQFNKMNSVQVIPEYGIGFLDAAREHNCNVLYANMQNMSAQDSAEYNRAEMISRHEETHHNFFFLSLPFDGPIIKKIKLGTIDDCKKLLVDSLIHQQFGFRIPKALHKEFSGAYLKKEFDMIADRIHQLYFRDELDIEQRPVFLMIFYHYITEYMKAHFEIKALVTACKDNKDRGNAMAGVHEALHNLRLGKDDDHDALYNLYVKTLSPFIIKYEHIIPHRLELLVNVLKHLATLTDENRKVIRNDHVVSGFSILDQFVPRERIGK